jgi:hypothetical protein
MTNIYNAFVDFYWCNGDTIRYNTGVGARSGLPTHGTDLYIAYNDFTGGPNVDGGGFNAGGSYNTSWKSVKFIGNAFRGVTDYGMHVNGVNHGEAFIFTGNTISGTCNQFATYQTSCVNMTLTDNTYCGSGDFIYHGTTYHSLAAFQSGTGYERGSVWNSGQGSPTGTFDVTPDTLPANGGTVKLKWTSINATSAAIFPRIGIVATSDSIETDTIYTTTLFELTLTGQSGSTKYSVLVTVKDQPASGTQLKYFLMPPYPNPFNGNTIIEFMMPNDGYASLKVFDILGREIQTLAQGMYLRGIHQFRWNAGTVASGVYYCAFTSGSITQTQRMVVVR